jgi:hypothetical protein
MLALAQGEAAAASPSTVQKPLRLAEVPAYIEARSGHRPSAESIYRWCKVGVRGRRLDTIRVGSLTLAYPSAIDRFLSETQD